MPVLDDEFFDTLLHNVADTFAVPASGPAAILRRVHRDDDERNGSGRTFGATGAARLGTFDDSGGSGDVDDSNDSGDVNQSPARAPGRTIRRSVRSHKVLSVAASVLVLIVVAGGAVHLGNGATRTTAALKAVSAPLHTRHATAPKAASSPKAAPSAPATGSTATNPAISSAGAAANSLNAPRATGTPSATTGSAFANQVGRPPRIEQTGSLDLSVGHGALSATLDQMSAVAVASGGFVASSQTHSGSAGGPPSGAVTLQVPVASFSAVLRQVEALGTVSQLTTNATDVTGQYVDLQSRITALEASRQQYLTIMTKASSIGDVLAVQAQLDTLQSQIAQLQGQLGVLGSETDYSRMSAVVTERGGAPHHHAAAAAPSGLDRAWHESVHGFVEGVEGLIRIAGPTLFALLCLGAVLLGGQLFWRRLQRHNL